jgi:hypothetical protein
LEDESKSFHFWISDTRADVILGRDLEEASLDGGARKVDDAVCCTAW